MRIANKMRFDRGLSFRDVLIVMDHAATSQHQRDAELIKLWTTSATYDTKNHK